MSKKIFKLLIVGSRSFTNFDLLREQAYELIQPYLATHDIIVVSGGAKGADTLGEQFAHAYRFEKEIYLAKWNNKSSPTYNPTKGYDPVAGYTRNEEMRQHLIEGDDYACIAFWDGKSRGTKENFAKLKARNIPTVICEYNPQQQLSNKYML